MRCRHAVPGVPGWVGHGVVVVERVPGQVVRSSGRHEAPVHIELCRVGIRRVFPQMIGARRVIGVLDLHEGGLPRGAVAARDVMIALGR